MEENMEAKKTSVMPNKAVIIIVAAALIVIAVVAFVMFGREKEDDSGRIGYSADSVVLLDEDSLQAALDAAAANAKQGNVALWYRNTAVSGDGITFDCFVGNSKANLYDCFLSIFTDAELTDQVFMSGLVPPGSGFEQITLERALKPGMNTVYVVISQVTDDENGEQVMKGQVVHTMDFYVTE